MIPRRTRLKRSTKPIPQKRAKPRRGPLRSPEYRAWIRQTGTCPACRVELARLQVQTAAALWRLRAAFSPGHCDPCHTANGGMRMKGPDSSCTPLCRGFDTPNHHTRYDSARLSFEVCFGLDMQHEAALNWEAFQAAYGKG